MKRCTLFLALFGSLLLHAQQNTFTKNSQGELEISDVVRVDSFPAAQFFYNATLFLRTAFQGVRETSQLKDEKAKTVATKGSFPVTVENSNGEAIHAKVFFTLIIQAREGMYKYTLNDFYFGYTEETGITSYASFNDHLGVAMNKRQWQQVEAQTAVFASDFVLGLKQQVEQTEILCKEVLTANRKRKAGKN